MTLKEFYEQIDSDYKDVIKRLCDEDMIKKFVFKFPELKQMLHNKIEQYLGPLLDKCIGARHGNVPFIW